MTAEEAHPQHAVTGKSPEGVSEKESKKTRWQRFTTWFRWVLFGPEEKADKALFDKEWADAEAIKDEDERREALQSISELVRHHFNERTQSLRTVAPDAATLSQQVGLIILVAGVVFQNEIREFLDSSQRHFIWLLGVMWYSLVNAHTPRFFYTFFTHFWGIGRIVEGRTTNKMVVDWLRKDGNSRARRLQNGRRALGVGKAAIIILGFLICWYVSFGK